MFTLVSYDVFITNESCYKLNVFHLLFSSRNTYSDKDRSGDLTCEHNIL